MRAQFLLVLVAVFLLSTRLAIADDPEVRKLQIGDTIETYTLEDQHGAKHTLGDGTRHVLISGTMSVSKAMNLWLNEKDSSYLERNSAEYISDITEMPSLVTWLFAGPKMRKYSFPILLVDDEDFAPKYPLQEDKILIIDLDPSKKVTGISYFETMDQIEKEKFSSLSAGHESRSEQKSPSPDQVP